MVTHLVTSWSQRFLVKFRGRVTYSLVPDLVYEINLTTTVKDDSRRETT